MPSRARRLRRSLLLGFTLCVATMCRDPSIAPEVVFYGATVRTLGSTRSTVTVIAIAGGKIVALADDLDPAWDELKPEMVWLGGTVVAPAFTDHHVHLFNVGMALLNQRDGGRLSIDLSHVTSLSAVDSLLRARVATLPAGSWVLGSGWSQANWGSQSLPTADVLTRAAPHNPVLFARTDGHAAWLNAQALSRAGVTRASAEPASGAIVRRRSGEPSGVLLEEANALLTRVVPPLADSDVMTAFRLAAEALAERGVVEVYDAGPLLYPGVVALNLDFGHYLALLLRADSAAPLPLRIDLMVPAPSRLADSLLAASGPIAPLSPRIRITHLKLFADGALGSRGAALTHRYADDSATRGVTRMSSDEIAALGRRALDRGLGVATHAIGDEAVRRTLDAYETLLRERPGLEPRRLRIEHFSYAREEDMARAARLGVLLSVQSDFNALPGEDPTLGAARVGAANEPRVYNWARLAAMGAVMAEGSDYFALPGAPLAGFIAMLERKYALAQALPDSAARLAAYRTMASRFEPEGTRIPGDITVGAPADFVAWSADPLSAPRSELDSVTAKLVVNAGRIVVGPPPNVRFAAPAPAAPR